MDAAPEEYCPHPLVEGVTTPSQVGEETQHIAFKCPLLAPG